LAGEPKGNRNNRLNDNTAQIAGYAAWGSITEGEARDAMAWSWEYLDRVQKEWDGVLRIGEWLSTYMQAKPSTLTGTIGVLALVAAACTAAGLQVRSHHRI